MTAPTTTLLIVNDEPSLCTALSTVFGQLGCQVRSAYDGFAALALIEELTPSILLSEAECVSCGAAIFYANCPDHGRPHGCEAKRVFAGNFRVRWSFPRSRAFKFGTMKVKLGGSLLLSFIPRSRTAEISIRRMTASA